MEHRGAGATLPPGPRAAVGSRRTGVVRVGSETTSPEGGNRMTTATKKRPSAGSKEVLFERPELVVMLHAPTTLCSPADRRPADATPRRPAVRRCLHRPPLPDRSGQHPGPAGQVHCPG